jgi:hypothetical protein
MKKACWFVLALTLGLIVALFGVAGGGLTRPVNADDAGPGEGFGGAVTLAPQLGSFIDIWVDDVENYTPAVAYNSNHDEYLVVWENYRPATATRDIYAQRVGSDGSLKSWFCVVHASGSENWQPDVSYSPTQDEYLIVYTYEVNANDYDLWARRVSWNGSSIYSEFAINQDADYQLNPSVAYNSQDDEYLVVYENWWSGGMHDIDARRVRASDGTPLGNASGVNIATGAGELRSAPDVAYNAARNEYLIAYTYQSGPTADGDIYGKVASANLGTLSGEIQILWNANLQNSVAVTAGPDEYLAVWQDGPSSTYRTIYSRRVSGTGTTPDPSFVIADHSNVLAEPAVGYGSGYGYLVTWAFDTGSAVYDVYGRYVMPGQSSAAGNEFTIDGTAHSQEEPAVACAPSGDCLVVEEDNYESPATAGDYEIRGRFVEPYNVYLPLILRNYP